jgi:predicted amidohydrolase
VRVPLRVAAVQPACTAKDVKRNARAHADAVLAARARVVVFPELSLTGYELDADTVDPEGSALEEVARACAVTGSSALVGAPVHVEGRDAIAMLHVDAEGARVAYCKTWLGGDDADRFAPGDGHAVLQVHGWRLGLGICKDTGAAQHIAGTAALGVDAYVAGLVHLPRELPEQEARAVVLARACRAYVVFASFAGPTGGGYTTTAGSSAVFSPDGVAIARAGRDVGGIARATLT